MSWVFLIIRDSTVEKCKVYLDYFAGEYNANEFIRSLDPSVTDFPKYRQGEVYKKDDLTVGLYPSN